MPFARQGAREACLDTHHFHNLPEVFGKFGADNNRQITSLAIQCSHVVLAVWLCAGAASGQITPVGAVTQTAEAYLRSMCR